MLNNDSKARPAKRDASAACGGGEHTERSQPPPPQEAEASALKRDASGCRQYPGIGNESV